MVAVGVPGGNVSSQNDAGWVGFLTAGLDDPRAVDSRLRLVFQERLRLVIGSVKHLTLGLIAGTLQPSDAAGRYPGRGPRFWN